jgi:hypothetical protein
MLRNQHNATDHSSHVITQPQARNTPFQPCDGIAEPQASNTPVSTNPVGSTTNHLTSTPAHSYSRCSKQQNTAMQLHLLDCSCPYCCSCGCSATSSNLMSTCPYTPQAAAAAGLLSKPAAAATADCSCSRRWCSSSSKPSTSTAAALAAAAAALVLLTPAAAAAGLLPKSLAKQLT